MRHEQRNRVKVRNPLVFLSTRRGAAGFGRLRLSRSLRVATDRLLGLWWRRHDVYSWGGLFSVGLLDDEQRCVINEPAAKGCECLDESIR